MAGSFHGWSASVVAFWRRVFPSRLVSGDQAQSRACGYLHRLANVEDENAFPISLRNLSREHDLLSEEAALRPDTLELQVRIVELAQRDPEARRIADEMLSEWPIAKLFAAVLAQARTDDARSIRIDLGSSRRSEIRIWFAKPSGWSEVMTTPGDIAGAVRGFAVRLERVGYATARPYFPPRYSPTPEAIHFVRLDEQTIEIALEPEIAASVTGH
jgi:hypothetical protein